MTKRTMFLFVANIALSTSYDNFSLSVYKKYYLINLLEYYSCIIKYF